MKREKRVGVGVGVEKEREIETTREERERSAPDKGRGRLQSAVSEPGSHLDKRASIELQVRLAEDTCQ